MINKFTSLLFLASISIGISAQDVTVNRVSCHDPSIFMDTITTGTKESPVYYIYGSHLGRGKTTAEKNYINWQVFGAGEENKTATNSLFADQNGNPINYSQAYGDARKWQFNGYNVEGNQWAPDVIWNKKMKKWCMYMSLNGDKWHCSIVLFTSDRPDGGWQYVGPVVYSGFNGKNDHIGYVKTDDYKHTDLEKVIGTQASLPARYNKGDSWGTFWPNCIDPCVFYDEEGKLWMSYGSWSGGIFIFQLDENTGLRDYNITYESVCSTPGDYATCTSDPYFGKKIAGGYYSSGEASYIEHIGNYYYLFMSYGGLAATGDFVGYQMRVFRSEKPDGPYVDCLTANGQSAIYDKAYLNYGHNAAKDFGVRIMSSYKWDDMRYGEIAQGHNSAIVDHKGRALLVYHTRFVNYAVNPEAHEVRVHQMFVNKDGWLVVAPFEFYGEEITDKDLESNQQYGKEEVAGEYQLIIHKYRQNALTQECATPVKITLNASGSVTGAYSGTWSLTPNTGYITITLKKLFGTSGNDATFEGVVIDQAKSKKNSERTICFTALSSSKGMTLANRSRGLCIWGAKTEIITDLPNISAEDINNTGVIFDILGRPQNQLRQGYNIRNGRVVIVK